jgi:exodeoxyribonuclease VII large subunit
MSLRPVSVTQLNDYISRVIGTDPLLSSVTVQGETSGVKYHSSGHVYMSLVDGASRINCFIPRDYAAVLGFVLSDGMDVVLKGGVSVFKKNGTYSLFVRSIEVAGEGDLSAAFEELKNRLNKEGLFDKVHKKSLPAFPYRVGVVTSNTGAAIRDILKIIKSRNDFVDVAIFPVLVQGDGAAPQIAAAIDYINENFSDIDVLIVGRGGGSAEDLWAFNEEIVARSIYRSEIPVISAVGHEIDFTISDMVADVRAETPTAAAQMAVPDTSELAALLEDLKNSMTVQLKNNVMYNGLKAETMAREMKDVLLSKIESSRNAMENLKLILTENDPRMILENGYSIMEGQDGRVITDSAMLDRDQDYRLTFNKGYAYCRITEIGSDENDG